MDIDQVEEVIRRERHLVQRLHDLGLVVQDVKDCTSKDFFPKCAVRDFMSIMKASKPLREAFVVEVERERAALKVDLKVLEDRMADWS